MSNLRRVSKYLLAGVVSLAAVLPGEAQAQAQAQAHEARFQVYAGLDAIFDYPESLRPNCDSGFGLAPNLRASRRLGTQWAAEVGVSVPIALATERSDALDGGCGVPFPGTTSRDSPRGSPSVVPELRMAFLPGRVAGESFRVTVGSGWYAGRSGLAALAGVGYAWERAFLDVEHWRVSVPFDVVETPMAGDPVVGDSGREWTGLWQVRVGMRVWQR